MKKRNLTPSLLAIFLFSLVPLHPPTAVAVDRFWQDGTDSYTNAGFWSTGVVPGSGDNAINTNGGANVVLVNVGDPDWTANDLRAGNGAGGNGAFQQNGQTVTLNGWLRLAIGATETGSFTMNDGTLNVSAVNSRLAVGELGTGFLNINGGTIRKTSTGGTITVGDGAGGTGLVTQTSGVISNAGQFWLGGNATGRGTYNISGGTNIAANWLVVGFTGVGTLNVSGSGVVSNTVQNITLGSQVGSRGMVTVDTGTMFAQNQLWVGESGANSSLLVTNGGTVRSLSHSAIGLNASANTGRGTVTGTNSLWSIGGTLSVGGSSGTNTLTVADGGRVFVSGGARVGSITASAANTLLVTDLNTVFSNGNFFTVGEAGSGNTVIISNGAQLVQTSSVGVIGHFSTAASNQVIVTGSSGSSTSTWQIAGNLIVGGNNGGNTNNSLTISDGGRVFDNLGTIGNNATAYGNSVLLTGSSSIWSNNGIVTVGSGNSFTMSNGTFISTSTLNVNGILRMNAGSMSVNNIQISPNAAAAGALYQAGGTNLINAAAGLADLPIGAAAGAYGYYKLSGGRLYVNEVDVGGAFNNSVGVMEITGGTFTNAGWLTVGRGQGSSGLLNIDGGNVDLGGTVANSRLSLNTQNFTGTGSGTNIVNLRNGAITGRAAANMYLELNEGANASNLSAFNILSNSVLTIYQVSAAQSLGTTLLNFNGGTLKATSPNAGANFLTSANIDRVYIYSGGATIDDNGTSITVSRSLQAPTGNGVTSIVVADKGSGYKGAPLVTITGGTGDPATAYAVMEDDATGNGTYRVASITVSSAGNYSVDPSTVTLIGGGPLTAASGFTINTGPNTSGSFTKNGAGLLTLGGLNSYTGGTVVNGGTLAFSSYDNVPAGLLTVNNATLRLTTDSTFFFDGLNPYTINWGTFSGGIDVPSAWDSVTPLKITNNITSAAFTKSGAGVVTLTGTNTLSGVLTVSGGTLQLNSSLSVSNVTLNGGALQVDSSLTSSNLTMTSGSTLALRADVDTTFNAGAFTLGGATYNFQVNSINSPAGDGRTLTLDTQAGASVNADTTINVSSTTGDTLKFGTSATFHLSGNSGSAWGGNNNFFNLTGANVILNGMDDTAGNADVVLVLASSTGNSLTINGTVANNAARTIGATVNSGILNLNNTVTDGLSGNHGFYVTVNAGTLNLNNNCINNNAAIGGTGNRAGLAIAGGNLGNTSGGAVTLFGNPTIGISADFTFVGTNDLNLGTGAVRLQNGNRTVTVNQNTLTLGGAISDGGATNGLIKAGAGTLSVRSGNSYLGNTIINSGTLITDLTGAAPGTVTPFGPQGSVTLSNQATVRLGQNPGGNNNAIFYITNSVSLDGASIIAEDANEHIAGYVSVTSNGGTFGSTYNNGLAVAAEKDKGLSFDGVVSGSGNLTLKHTDIDRGHSYNCSFVAFTNNANTYSGTITVVPMTNYTGAAGGSFLGVNGSYALSNATINLLGNNPGNATNFGFSPVVFKTGLGPATLGALSGTGAVVLTGYNETNHVYGGDSVALSVGGNNASTTYYGVMSGAGSLTKAGSGTWTTAGTNTYTGTTLVNSGTLLVNGVHTNGGAYTVAAGGTLGGTGTINAPVTIADGATLSPGSSPGTLRINGDLVLSNASVLAYDLGTGGNDLTVVNGSLTLDGIVNVTASGSFVAGDYTLFSYGTLAADNGLAVGTIPGGLSGSVSNDTVNKLIVLHVTSGGGGDPYASWVSAYGLAGSNALGTADPDGDGMSNTNEFLAGFNPTNSAAYAHIISVARSNVTDIAITYLAANGDSSYFGGPAMRTNVLEFATGTGSGSYTNAFVSTGITNVFSGGTGLGTNVTVTDGFGATNSPARYYRVRVLAP